MGFEVAHRFAALGFVEALGDQAHHFSLVILVRPEHIEEFEAHPLRREFRAVREAIGYREIEQVFAEAVQIHGPKPLQGRK